jgi:hypothetical protein
MRIALMLLFVVGLTLLAGCDKPIHEANAPIQWSVGR